MGVPDPFIFFFVILSWTGQQAQCYQNVEETKRAEIFLVGPLPTESCKIVVCMHRNGRIGLKPNKPEKWTEKEFLDAFGKCIGDGIGEFNVKADQIICGF